MNGVLAEYAKNINENDKREDTCDKRRHSYNNFGKIEELQKDVDDCCIAMMKVCIFIYIKERKKGVCCHNRCD